MSELDDNFSGDVLTSLPMVTERVFRYLNARDLMTCSRVCQEWKRTYHIVKRRRQDPLVIYEQAPETSNEKSRDRSYKTHELIQKFQHILDSSYMEPKFGIVFICNMEPMEVRKIETSLRVGNTFVWNFCISYYRLAALLGISGGGTTSVFPGEFPQRSPCISALFFPQFIPEVEFYSFKILEEFPPTIDSADVISNVTKIPHGQRVKCLLIFKASPFYIVRSNLLLDPAKAIMNYYMMREKNKIAMGGTQAGFTHFIPSNTLPQDDQPRYVGVGLAITGDKFEAASVLIPPQITTKEDVLEKLNTLKRGIVLRKKTYALLFTSSRMGKQQYDKPDVESLCFKEVFPNVRLIGMKSHGMFNTREIIGTTYFPANQFTQLPSSDTFIHNNCSVFIILTWG